MRCVVAQDESGGYRAAIRIGRGDGARFEVEFAKEQFATKEVAIEASREITRGFLSADAEQYASRVTGKKPGEEIVRVRMDDGWSTSINEAMKPDTRAAEKLLASATTPREDRGKGGAQTREKTRLIER